MPFFTTKYIGGPMDKYWLIFWNRYLHYRTSLLWKINGVHGELLKTEPRSKNSWKKHTHKQCGEISLTLHMDNFWLQQSSQFLFNHISSYMNCKWIITLKYLKTYESSDIESSWSRPTSMWGITATLAHTQPKKTTITAALTTDFISKGT
jgi:hypothetical protein